MEGASLKMDVKTTEKQTTQAANVPVKHPKVSVIVPIYNVERFLDECLKSIREQTLSELEIICVNDGSTDASSSIMHAHAEKDARITCVDKANAGYGSACNTGIKLARGKYIAIAEPDDFLKPNMYGRLLALNEKLGGSVDVVKCAWLGLHLWNNPKTAYQLPGDSWHCMKTSKATFTLNNAPQLFEGHPAIWAAIYRREFLENNNITFKEYPGAGWADNPFLAQTLCEADSIAFLDEMLYCYRCELPAKQATKPNVNAGESEGSGGIEQNTCASDATIAMPFERWVEMSNIMQKLNVADEGVWQAHVLRLFNYIDDANAVYGAQNEVVQAKTLWAFGQLEARHVLSCKKLSPAKKRFYFEVLGKPVPKISSVPYVAHLARQTVHTAATQGLRGLGRQTRAFVGARTNKPS